MLNRLWGRLMAVDAENAVLALIPFIVAVCAIARLGGAS